MKTSIKKHIALDGLFLLGFLLISIIAGSIEDPSEPLEEIALYLFSLCFAYVFVRLIFFLVSKAEHKLNIFEKLGMIAPPFSIAVACCLIFLDGHSDVYMLIRILFCISIVFCFYWIVRFIIWAIKVLRNK